MAKVKGLGASINYLPAYDSGDTPTVIGSLTSIGEIAPSAEELDATCLDSSGGYREFMQGFKDSGELTITGYHDKTDTGQVLCRTLYGTGANGYYWIEFSDGAQVIFTAFLKGYAAGAADVDGLVGFAATLRITGLVQNIQIKDAVAQTIANGATATMDSTATAQPGTPTYQWYSNDEENYTTPTIAAGETDAEYTTGALSTGTYYYFCVVSVSGYRAINSQIHVITVSA